MRIINVYRSFRPPGGVTAESFFNTQLISATLPQWQTSAEINFGHTATAVDNGRHQQKLISATRPRGHTAARPRRHVAFLDKPLRIRHSDPARFSRSRHVITLIAILCLWYCYSQALSPHCLIRQVSRVWNSRLFPQYTSCRNYLNLGHI